MNYVLVARCDPDHFLVRADGTAWVVHRDVLTGNAVDVVLAWVMPAEVYEEARRMVEDVGGLDHGVYRSLDEVMKKRRLEA